MTDKTIQDISQATIDSLKLHVRSYRSALKSTHEITIDSLTNSHLKMDPILHQYGSTNQIIDISSFVYTLLRLPEEIDLTNKIVAGPIPEVFAQAGFKDVNTWPKTTSPARRRKYHFHRADGVLACYINSISDIDDLVNLAITYQVEWNKLHNLLQINDINKLLTETELSNLSKALGENFEARLKKVKKEPKKLRIQLLAGSWVDYCKATQKWWKNIAKSADPKLKLTKRPIYFVSSNTHSIVNLISGYALKNKTEILEYTKQTNPTLYNILGKIKSKEISIQENDYLYFISRQFLHEPKNAEEKLKFEKKLKIDIIPSSKYLDINTQIIPVRSLAKSEFIDGRLKISDSNKLSNSDALIFNIDYPLGFAAYHILSEILENVQEIKGVYIMGKAAVLNSEIGDIQIPRFVYNEHTENSYIFNNCFNTFFPFKNLQGSILTNQKAVSVLGTYIENEALLKRYSEENLTVIEMESGPYLEAISEATFDHRHTMGETIDLNSTPFDVGIIDYTSDTPYSKAKNMGVKTLTLDGVEPTYLASLAILQRIINLEESR